MTNHETHIGPYPPAVGEWDCSCARCGSSLHFENCDWCGGSGYDRHDCGDDTCCCLDPEDNIPCGLCDGRGGWWACLSSAAYCEAHPLPGREGISRSTPEWYPAPDVSAYAGGQGGCTRGAIITGLFGLACVVGIVALAAWWMGGAW